MTTPDLTRNVLNGAVIITVVLWLVRLGTVAMHVILARILSVEQYGVAVIAFILIALQQFIPNLGYSTKLVQRIEGPSKRELNTAWTVDILICRLFFAFLIYLSAPFLAVYFGIPTYEKMVTMCALVSICAAFENSATVVLFHNLEYRRRSILVLSQGTGMTLTTIVLAFLLQSPWAVVWGGVAGRAARSTVSYMLVHHIPKPSLYLHFLKVNISFAAWMIGVSFTTKLRGYLDKIIVARLLGSEGLALFQLATRISTQTIRDVLRGGKQTLFPAVSKVQNQKKRMARASRIAIQMITFLAGLFSATLFIMAEPIVIILLGEKWVDVIPILRLACIATVFLAVNSIIPPILRGAGSPDKEFLLQVTALVLLFVFIAPLTMRYDVVGAAFGLIAAEAVQFGMGLALLSFATGPQSLLLLSFIQPLLWITPMFAIVFFVLYALQLSIWLNLLVGLFLLLCLGLITFFTASRIGRMDSVDLIAGLLKDKINAFRDNMAA